jgi:branched-chain amino acid transport system permease protein
MEQLILFAVLGLGSGAMIAAIGCSVVLTFRGSGVVNLAAGAVAMIIAYVYSSLRSEGVLFLSVLRISHDGIPFVPAMLISLVVAALLGAVLYALVFGPLRGAPPVAPMVAAAGVMLVLQAIVVLRFTADVRSVPNILPGGPDDTLKLFGASVPENRLWLALLALLGAGALWAIFRFTRSGLATRAAAESEKAAMLAGLSPRRLACGNWILATVFAGAVGIVVSPITQLNPVQLTLLVIPALGAALLGNMRSFWITALAGLGIGIAQSEITYLQTMSWFPTSGGLPLPGIAGGLPFVIIAVVMFVRGTSLPVRGAVVPPRPPFAPRPDRVLLRASIPTALAVIGLLTLSPDWRQALIFSIIGAVVCLSLVVITGYLGQTSLAHMALAGTAGFVLAQVCAHTGLGFPLAPLVAILASCLLGVVVALPALRVQGVSLAVITLAAAVAVEEIFFKNPSWGGGQTSANVPSPGFLGLSFGPSSHFGIGDGLLPNPGFGLFCLLVLVLVGLGVVGLRRSTLGQRMLAVRADERAAAGAGIDVPRTKMIGFVISAAVAGVSGVLYSYNFGSVSASRFDVLTAVAFLAFAYLGGITTVTGAVVGGILVTQGLSFHALESWFGLPSEWDLLVAGLGLIVTVVLNPVGIAGALRETVDKLARRRGVAWRFIPRAVRGTQ